VAWATDGLQRFDTSVSALAHQLGVSWHTAWDAMEEDAGRRLSAIGRLTGVNALGVDAHVWSHTGPPGSGMVTGIVDHTRDAHGVVHARLLDLVPGRSGKAYASWLKARGEKFTAGIKTAALDAFRVVKLGSAMVDEVRRRVQQDTLGHRGRKGDPLYGIRRTLQVGTEHRETHPRGPGPRGHHRLAVLPEARQHLPRKTRARQGTRQRGDCLIPALPDPRSRPAGRTLKQWKAAILAYFDTFGASNGPTEASNGVIETTRRIVRGFRNFTNYRLRCLLAACVHCPYRTRPTNHA
jgi:transposase